MKTRPYKIGVFDSGVGGENVTAAVKVAMPKAIVIARDDRKNLPYGNKSPEQLVTLIKPIIDTFIHIDAVDAIVIACNTVATNCLPDIKKMVNIPVVGFVPMLKPAAATTKTGVITVCATPGTLASARYKELKVNFCSNITVIEPDCSDWAELIEDDSLDDDRLKSVIKASQALGSDTVVLGCTHYHWIKERLEELSGANIEVMQPTDSVVAQLLKELGQSG